MTRVYPKRIIAWKGLTGKDVSSLVRIRSVDEGVHHVIHLRFLYFVLQLTGVEVEETFGGDDALQNLESEMKLLSHFRYLCRAFLHVTS